MLQLKSDFGTSGHTDNSLEKTCEKSLIFLQQTYISLSSNTTLLNGIFSLKNKLCAFLIHSFNKLLLILR